MAAPPAPPPDWATLQSDLLQRCLLAAAPNHTPTLASCKAWARALLLGTLQRDKPARLRLDVDRNEAFAPSANLFHALVGDVQPPQHSKAFTLELRSDARDFTSPAPCLDQLRAAGVHLTCIARLELWGLELRALIPDGLDELVPNLQQLRVDNCTLEEDASGTAICTSFSRLQHVEVDGFAHASDDVHSLQLTQLAALPSLSSLRLLRHTCPTLCLISLSLRLTQLHLDSSYGEVEPDTLAPSARWTATLRHIARCTRLESLAIPCASDEELGLVAPALVQLRRLHLNTLLPWDAVQGDAVVERLLGLLHLTSLQWDHPDEHVLQQSYAQRPCHWKELSFVDITPHLLARLPLHSLTSPVRWAALVVDHRTSVAEAQAAVANLTARCQAGWHWKPPPEKVPTLHFMPSPNTGGAFAFDGVAEETDTPAALMRATGLLLAGLKELAITRLAWDVELVKVLGEVLPRSCVKLCLTYGALPSAACLELASSLPWLEDVRFSRTELWPAGVAVFAGAVGTLARAAAAPGGRSTELRWIRVIEPVCPEGEGVDAHREAWDEMRDEVLSLGLGVRFELKW